jgi:ABC-type multidrug transport system fused ATPase/permease subunit
MRLFWKNPNFNDLYFNFLDRVFNFEKRIKLFDVDFAKPWYVNLLKKKYRYLFIMLSELSYNIFEPLVPIGFGIAISQQKYEYILYIGFAFIFFEIFNSLAVYVNILTNAEVQGSISVGAQEFFLTVDPIYHSTKSSGSILSKIQAGGGRDFIMMINSIFFNVLPIITSYITVTVTLVYFNGYLGIIATVFFIIITILTSFFRYINSSALSKKWINARDKYASVSTENLVQNALIRSSFATIEIMEKTKKLAISSIITRSIMFMGGITVTLISRILYTISILIIGYGILDLVQNNTISPVIGTTIIITYMSGSRQVLRIGETIGDITESIANVNDLFTFITSFGKQTFPVLPEKK